MSLRGSIPRAPTHMAGLGRVRRAPRALGPVRRRPRARRRSGRITAGDADESQEIRTDHDGALEPGRADDYEDDDDHRARGVDHGSDVDDRSDLHDNRRVDHNHGDDCPDRAAAPVAADDACDDDNVDDSGDRYLDHAYDDDDVAVDTDNLSKARSTSGRRPIHSRSM